ncbi:hypothetical protein [Pelagibius marinus]|uniref:hypothetical protein n=1 Tax=Pelagibius marinus TaxID=2762760 RepID=UPI0018723655|nr:hypothetical protein [Pelagibius marinus]
MYALSQIYSFYQRIFWWMGRKRQERPFTYGLVFALACLCSIALAPYLLKPIVPFGVTFLATLVLWAPLLFMYFRQD